MNDKNFAEAVENGKQIERAMQEAVRNALREHKRNGQYIVVWRDGKIVQVPPEEIAVPDFEDNSVAEPTAKAIVSG
jgi:isoaspartyl peptidase/L-asparaginase-like protein (Ntn-hydrolase superfamily)